ncbi:MAG TPA: biopolymer transporter ExbD [Verrucomicrobiae bacterium]|nr:biopolymer transporter ExbD [Verrucomicrobiae bacterium]
MTFKTHCQISKGLVDPAPLVDVVFLLLLFFILSSPFVMQSGFGVIMPTTPVPTRSSFPSLVLTVTRDNLLFFNNQPVTLENFGQALREAIQQKNSHELIIKADRAVSFGTIVQIRSIAIKAGITSVNEAARAEASLPGATP